MRILNDDPVEEKQKKFSLYSKPNAKKSSESSSGQYK